MWEVGKKGGRDGRRIYIVKGSWGVWNGGVWVGGMKAWREKGRE